MPSHPIDPQFTLKAINSSSNPSWVRGNEATLLCQSSTHIERFFSLTFSWPRSNCCSKEFIFLSLASLFELCSKYFQFSPSRSARAERSNTFFRLIIYSVWVPKACQFSQILLLIRSRFNLLKGSGWMKWRDERERQLVVDSNEFSSVGCAQTENLFF